jgi:ribA/ribD-fused uncharacterized protein
MERITDTHVYFWKSRIANWHPCQFTYKSLTFFNTEQAFMWEKAIYFGDMEMAEKIMKTPDPKEAKALGRKVKNFDADLWSEQSYKIMVDVNFAKFSQDRRSKYLLLSTEDKILVETNPYDKIWAIGLHWSDDDVLDETKWKGQNLLGKALMECRNMLRQNNNIS